MVPSTEHVQDKWGSPGFDFWHHWNNKNLEENVFKLNNKNKFKGEKRIYVLEYMILTCMIQTKLQKLHKETIFNV